MIGNKKFTKNSQLNYSEIVTNELDKEIPKERYGSPGGRKQIIDEPRLKWKHNNEILKNHKSLKKCTIK